MTKRTPSRSEAVSVLSVAVTQEEEDAALAMMQASGCPSYANLLRSALWHYGRHLQIDLPVRVFGLGRDEAATQKGKRK